MRTLFDGQSYAYNDAAYEAERAKEREKKRLQQEGLEKAIELKQLSIEGSNLIDPAEFNKLYHRK